MEENSDDLYSVKIELEKFIPELIKEIIALRGDVDALLSIIDGFMEKRSNSEGYQNFRESLIKLRNEHRQTELEKHEVYQQYLSNLMKRNLNDVDGISFSGNDDFSS